MQSKAPCHSIIHAFIVYLEQLPNLRMESLNYSRSNGIGKFLKLAYTCERLYNINVDFGNNWIFKELYVLYKGLHESPNSCKIELQAFTIALALDYENIREESEFTNITIDEALQTKQWLDNFFPFSCFLLNREDQFTYVTTYNNNLKLDGFMLIFDQFGHLKLDDPLFQKFPQLYEYSAFQSKEIRADNVFKWFTQSENRFYIIRFLSSRRS